MEDSEVHTNKGTCDRTKHTEQVKEMMEAGRGEDKRGSRLRPKG